MLLEPGRTCWRAVKADRAAVLVENATYFSVLERALARARKSILLIGWTFDPRTRFDGQGPTDRSREIGFTLRRLVRENPELNVRLLIWRSPLPIAFSQGFFPQRAGPWFKRERLQFRLDRARPIGACHHQKIVVIDDKIAFTGGGDVSTDRWDTAEHLDEHPRRRTPTGREVRARHDVMTLVDGEAAGALSEIARGRWQDATGERVEPVRTEHDPWPEDLAPDLAGVRVGFARTEPAWRGRSGVRESELLHLEAIHRARKVIHLENQYLTSPLVASAIAGRLQEKDGPEVVVVTTGKSPSWFDQATMDRARIALFERIRSSDKYGRFSAFTPLTPGGASIIVHSKVATIDDVLVRVGSTNLNNRSAGFDTELDAAFEAVGPDDPVTRFAPRLRNGLIGHFVGVGEADFARAVAETGGYGAAVRALDPDGRRLKPLTQPSTPWTRFVAEHQLGDPTSPADSWRPWRRRKLTKAVTRAVAKSGPEPAPQAAGDSSRSTTSGR